MFKLIQIHQELCNVVWTHGNSDLFEKLHQERENQLLLWGHAAKVPVSELPIALDEMGKHFVNNWCREENKD